MPEAVEALTTAALSLALDAATLRQQAIAANIANAGTEHYRPMRVAFEDSLEQARQAVRDNGSVDRLSLASARVELQTASDVQGDLSNVQLDVQMADMARNAVQYQALVQGLSRHLAILSMAAADGRK